MAGQITTEDTTQFTFITLKGQMGVMGQTLEEITRSGVDGHAYRQEGLRGDPFEMVGIVDVDSMDAAALRFEQYKALQGTLVTVSDDFDYELQDVAVLHVERMDLKPLLNAVGGLSTQKQALLTVKFTFQVCQ